MVWCNKRVFNYLHDKLLQSKFSFIVPDTERDKIQPMDIEEPVDSARVNRGNSHYVVFLLQKTFLSFNQSTQTLEVAQ